MQQSKTNLWTDEVLIREIRAGGQRRNTAWQFIYKAWRGYYLKPVSSAGGRPEEVDDVLAQVVVDVDKQLSKPEFALQKASLAVYFTESVYRAWATARSRATERQPIALDPEQHLPGQQVSVEQEYIWRDQLDRTLAGLGDRCRKILVLFGKGYSMQEIAGACGFQNEQVAKNEKMKCHRKLLELTDLARF